MNQTEHLLACLAEECAEVAQRAMKAQRFGLFEIQPDQELSNIKRLSQEVNDLLAVAEMLGLALSQTERDEKKRKVLKFMAYAESIGALDKTKETHANG